jgi:hypothetical protein
MENPHKSIVHIDCNIINNGKYAKFSVSRNSPTSSKKTTIKNCVHYGINLIQDKLKLSGLRIRPLVKKDLKSYDKYSHDLCGDMENMLELILGDLEDEEDKTSIHDISFDGGRRLTYVVVSLDDDNTILSIVSAIINYKDKSLRQTSLKFVEDHLEDNTVYIELGCSYQGKSKDSKEKSLKEMATGTNYFLRAYILLRCFEDMNIRKIWGQQSGDVKFLTALNTKRKCHIYEGTDKYYCDPIEFLNSFFETKV